MKSSAQCEINSIEWYLARCNEGFCPLRTIKNPKRNVLIEKCVRRKKSSLKSKDIEIAVRRAILADDCNL